MKKLYLSLLAFLGAILLALGVWSLAALDWASLPPLTAQSVFDHSAESSFESKLGDRFPMRNLLLEGNQTMNLFYYFSVGEENLLAIDYKGGAEAGGERLADLPEPVPAVELPEIDLPEETDVMAVGTVIVNGNRAMDIPTAEDEIITEFGNAVNRIAAAMPEQTRTFLLVTPNGGQFYSPPSYHTGIHDQSAMIRRCYDALSDRVTAVDAYSPIAQHCDEYLFFRTDHHWTQKGAYYAYGAFCDAAGFTARDLAEYESGSYEGFVGSMYNYLSGYPQSKVLEDNPDTLTYYLAPVATNARYYADASLENGAHVPLIDVALRDTITNKYLCYLGGDTPICVIETEAEGGTCIVVKESFGNAFIPFLAEHYSKIIAIDPREFNDPDEPQLNLASFAAEQKADDLLIIDYPFMINSKAYVQILNDLIPE